MGGFKIDQKKRKEIIDFLEIYECKSNGKWNLNGGYAKLKDVDIVEKNNSYIVYAGEAEIGDCFDEHLHREIFSDIWYVIDKEDFHLLEDEELEKRGLTDYEDIFDEETEHW